MSGVEVPKGYKQSEVGVIPEDWNIQKGEEITTLISKGASPRWQGFEYTRQGMLFITSENVRDGFLEITRPKYLPLEFNEKIKRTKIYKEDILINLVGASIGRSCQVKYNLGIANINQAVAVFRVVDKHNSYFIAYYLQSSTAIRQIFDMQVDAARPNISLGNLRQFLFPLPPTKAEQEAIAEALSDADGLIESLKQLIAKKQMIKQGAMQELLIGKKRLPGFSGEWKTTSFGGIVERIVGGGTPSRSIPDYWNGDIPWMTVKDFAQHDSVTTIEYITKKGLKNSASHLIPKHTLITSTRMALGKAVIFNVDITINQDLKAIFPTKEINTLFLYYWFQFNEAYIAEKGSGSTVMGISLNDLKKIPFAKPTLLEQTAIATILSDMDDEITALETKLSKARQIKQGMMQELLTGRVRLV
ncbi:MAG: restriction endonuclease subunit S [Desulfoplanes sp.]